VLSDDLPRSCQIKALANLLNSQFEIRDSPNGVIGVQQSLKDRVLLRYQPSQKTYSKKKKIRIKITGDNTRNLNVENITFMILEEGQIACSSMGNNTVSILKIPETYHATSTFYRQIDTNGKTHRMNHLESAHKLKDESTLSD